MSLLNDVVATRAERIDSLQRGYTSAKDEREIANLVLQTREEALTELKLRLDHGPGHRDLLELLYHDIDDRGVREEIIEHIRAHSPAIPPELRRVRVISDIDDTLYASLNDPTYVHGTLYPGITAFHEEIGRMALSKHSDVVDLILLTARPRDVLGLIENFTKRSLRRRGLSHTVVLSGSLVALRSHQAMAVKKLHNFELYQALYPEFDFIFIGDSGQGDASLGAMLLEKFPDRVREVLIHNLDGGNMTNKGIFAFQTYLGAILTLKEQGLADQQACSRVAEAVKRDLAEAEYRSPKHRERVLAAYLLDAENLIRPLELIS